MPQCGFTFMHCFIPDAHLLSLFLAIISFFVCFLNIWFQVCLIYLLWFACLPLVCYYLFRSVYLKSSSFVCPSFFLAIQSLNLNPDILYLESVCELVSGNWLHYWCSSNNILIYVYIRVLLNCSCIVVLLVNNKIIRLRFQWFYVVTIDE